MNLYRQLGGVLKKFIARIADFNNYGLVKLCRLSDVVKSDGLALPTSEKNSGLEGTIAYDIKKVEDSLNGLFYYYCKYNIAENVEDANGRSWFRACYLTPEQEATHSKCVNFSKVLPAPFNDRRKCILISASVFDGQAWFTSCPTTSFELMQNQVEVVIPNKNSAHHTVFSAIFIRADENMIKTNLSVRSIKEEI